MSNDKKKSSAEKKKREKTKAGIWKALKDLLDELSKVFELNLQIKYRSKESREIEPDGSVKEEKSKEVDVCIGNKDGCLTTSMRSDGEKNALIAQNLRINGKLVESMLIHAVFDIKEDVVKVVDQTEFEAANQLYQIVQNKAPDESEQSGMGLLLVNGVDLESAESLLPHVKSIYDEIVYLTRSKPVYADLIRYSKRLRDGEDFSRVSSDMLKHYKAENEKKKKERGSTSNPHTPWPIE